MKEKIYISFNENTNEFTYSGLTFNDFLAADKKIENILLLKGNHIGTSYIHNFEIIEKRCNIDNMLSEDIYAWGDFGFVDFKNTEDVKNMGIDDILQLLYISHMGKPLNTSFFKSLQNNYIYLSHDDGYYGKLYCREIMDFCTLINKKIYKYIFYNCHFKIGFNKSLNENLISLMKQGIIIDLQKIQITDNKCFAKIYVVGQYSNMDQIFNNYEDIINNSMYDLIMIN